MDKNEQFFKKLASFQRIFYYLPVLLIHSSGSWKITIFLTNCVNFFEKYRFNIFLISFLFEYRENNMFS